MAAAGGAAIRFEAARGRGVVLTGPAGSTEVRGAQPALLLARLVLGRPVALDRDELAELLWPDELPSHRAGAARQIVSRARRALVAVDLDPGRLTSDAGVVALDLADVDAQVDVEEALADVEAAAAALADGRRDDARGRAAAALAVLGQPFLPASSGPWVEAWRARLAAAHRRAEQIEVEALLADGAVGEATERALALAAADPTDEPAARLLMRVHEAAGNRAAALAVFEQLRRRLDDDLGIRPSPETEALHLHLLGDAPAPSPTSVLEPLRVPRAATGGGPFIGRAAERAALSAAWRRVVDGSRLEVVVVEGEAGIGKTRLAAELAVEVAGAGGRVLWGPAAPVGGPPRHPLGVLVDAVLAHDPAAGSVLAPFAGDLATIGVDLGSAGVAAPSPVDDAIADARLGRALAAAFDRGFAVPALLVADDLQLVADDALAALHDVVVGAADRPVLVVVTARHVRGGAARVLSSWERVAPVARLSLPGWTAAEVAEAIGAAGFGDGPDPVGVGPASPAATDGVVAEIGSAALVDVVRDRTAGNPLFVTQFVRHAQRSGAGLDVEALPAAVADVVDRRVAALDPADASVLGLAAVIGGEVPVPLVEDCAATPAAVVDQLERLGTEGFLVEEAAERFSFIHEVVREAVVAGLGPTRAGRLHRRVADALVAADAEPSAVAAHLVAAGPGAGEEATWWAVAAGNAALRAAAWSDAAARFTWALAEGPAPAVGVPARIGLGRARRATGDREGARQVLEEAIELASAHQLVPELAAATLSLVGGGGRGVAVDLADDERASLLRRALDALDALGPDAGRSTGAPSETAPSTAPPSTTAPSTVSRRPALVPSTDALLVDVLGELALALVLTEHVDERESLCARALGVARASGDPGLVAGALVTRRIGLMGPDHTVERATEAAEVRAMPTAEVAVERRLAALLGLVEDHVELGRRTVVDDAMAEARRLADDLDHPYWSWATSCWEVLLRMVDADLEPVEGEAFAALAHQADHPEAMAALGVQLVDLRLFEGRSGEMVDLLAEAADANPHIPAYRATLALCAAEAGDDATARAVLEHFAGAGFVVPRDSNELLAVSVLGDACATVGADEHAAALFDRLAPWSDRHVILNCYGGGGAYWGPVALVRGRLARRLGRSEEAAGLLAAAEAAAVAFGAPWFVARARAERASVEPG
ncbi:MAG: BTAD domain-containing putative transcriptional regulator [Acidimicrobiales bacterium]